MVSATPSGGWLYGSPVIPALGWPLGTRAQMFWLEEGLPSSLRPGARPRTTLSPGLALRDDKPWLAWGTPGGDQQEQWAFHVFLRHVDRGLNLQEAIDAPEFHTEHLISSFYPRGFVPRSRALAGLLRDRAAAAERDRRAPHGPRAQRVDPGPAHPLAPDARLQRVVAAGLRPRGHRDAERDREGAGQGGPLAPRPGTGEVPR